MNSENQETALLVFENVSEIDRTLYFEAVRLRGRSLMQKLCTVLGILLVPVGLLMCRFWIWILGILIILLAQSSTEIIGRRDYAKLLQSHPEGRWTKTVRFYEDCVLVNADSGSLRQESYGDICRVKESDHLLLIEFGKYHTSTFIRKDSFTIGTADRLKKFLDDMEVVSREEKKQNNLLHQLTGLITRKN